MAHGLVYFCSAEGTWTGAVEGTEAYSKALFSIPEDDLSLGQKQELDPLHIELFNNTANYRFPWG